MGPWKPLRNSTAFLLVLIAVATTPASGASPALADVPFAVANSILFDEPRNDGLTGSPGSWELVSGEMIDDGVLLTLALDPAPHVLPVRSGPAFIFAGLEAFGTPGGDVGFSRPIEGVTVTALEACDDADCHYDAEVRVPTAAIPDVLDEFGGAGEPTLTGLAINLTLVRTFGQGTWLQVIPMYAGRDGAPIDGRAGRLGAIEPALGVLYRSGLFQRSIAMPVLADPFSAFPRGLDYATEVERRRAVLPDISAPLDMIGGTLHVEFDPTCIYSRVLSLGTAYADRVFEVDVLDLATLDAAIAVPIDTHWSLTLHDGSGVDYISQGGWGIVAGDIVSHGELLDLDASFGCVEDGHGEVHGAGVAEFSPAPSRSPPEAAPTEVPTVEPSRAPDPSPTTAPKGGPIVIAVVLITLAAGVLAITIVSRRRLG